MRLLFAAIGTIAICTSAPAMADDRDEAVADIIACSAVRGAKARAKCYDAALPALKSTHPDALALALSRAEEMRLAAKEEAKEDFGLRGDRSEANEYEAAAFGEAMVAREDDDDDDDEVKSIESTAVEIGKNLKGKIFVVLENGQIWRQIDGDSSTPYIPGDGVGLPVRIKRGSFGSYTVKIGKARDVFKARRIK
ncbi:MAG: hypothetical protein KDA46_06815 [Parvularculaceae bacterium]|nr:hypothetical protein [Parvularculaceae bacterium]